MAWGTAMTTVLALNNLEREETQKCRFPSLPLVWPLSRNNPSVQRDMLHRNLFCARARCQTLLYIPIYTIVFSSCEKYSLKLSVPDYSMHFPGQVFSPQTIFQVGKKWSPLVSKFPYSLFQFHQNVRNISSIPCICKKETKFINASVLCVQKKLRLARIMLLGEESPTSGLIRSQYPILPRNAAKDRELCRNGT